MSTVAAVARKIAIPAQTIEEDPVLRAVLTAPIEPGEPPAEEREAMAQAKAAGGWVRGGSVSTEIAARSRRGR